MSLLRPEPPRALAALVLLVVGVACATTKTTTKEPREAPRSPIFLWKVTAEDRPGTVYLLGTVHFRSLDNAALDKAALTALDSADELVLEVAPDDGNVQRIQELTREMGLYPEGESLLEHLDEETRGRLTESAKKLGLPFEMFARMRPWLASLSLTVLRLKLEGYSEGSGIDKLLFARARKGAKRVSSLETPEEQIRLFAALDADTQRLMLQDSLQGVAEQRDHFGVIERAYAEGDHDTLLHLFREADDNPAYRALYRAIFDERNERMAERVLPYLDKEQRTFVAVGTGHLVGARGVPALLQHKGLRVEPVAAQGLAPAAIADGDDEGAREVSFEDEELGFQAVFHGEPKVVRQSLPTPGGGTADIIIISSTRSFVELSVIVNVFPVAVDQNPESVGAMLEGMAARLGQQSGTLEEKTLLTLQDHPAVRFVTKGESGRMEGYALVRGARIYTFFASYTGNASEGVEKERTRAAARFLSSFRLLPREPEEAPAPAGE